MIHYLVIINIIGIFIMYIDKKKAIKKLYRIPEKNLFFICMIGGSLGIIIGMYKFRHKTQHKKFIYGVPLLLIINILTIVNIF